MEDPFHYLALLIGVADVHVKFLFCILLSFPLGSLFIRVPANRANLKHLASVAISHVYLLGFLQMWGGAAHLLVDVLGTYWISRRLKTKYMPWIVFGLIMAHLTGNYLLQALQQSDDSSLEYKLDATTLQMVLTIKLVTFAWNIQDGRAPVEELDEWQRSTRIKTAPSLLELLGYAYFFPTCLAGPALDFQSYARVIDGTAFSAGGKSGASNSAKPGGLVPAGRRRAAFISLFQAVVYLGLYATLLPKFNYQLTLQPSFSHHPIWYRIAWLFPCGFILRCRYYGVWALAEGGCILAGYGFSGYDPTTGAPTWQAARSTDALKFEFPMSFKASVDAWNIKTNIWLRECLYKRLVAPSGKGGFGVTTATFVTSALWHGLSAGYFMSFVFAALLQAAGRLCRLNFRPFFAGQSKTGVVAPFANLKSVYDIAGIVCTLMAVNFGVAPFAILVPADCFQAWRQLGWYGLWMLVSCFAFFAGGGSQVLKSFRAQEAKRSN